LRKILRTYNIYGPAMEAHIYWRGYMKKQNDYLQSSEYHNAYTIKHLHSQCVTTWCILLSHGLTCPFFTDSSIIQMTYCEMPDTHFIYILDMVGVKWFINDRTVYGCTHKVKSVMSFCVALLWWGTVYYPTEFEQNFHATNLTRFESMWIFLVGILEGWRI
jgi:hypothetical protein